MTLQGTWVETKVEEIGVAIEEENNNWKHITKGNRERNR